MGEKILQAHGAGANVTFDPTVALKFFEKSEQSPLLK